ncbi:T9SS type A sorting domain-containing protein [Flavobacterium sp.]|uniref:T9SS type A sorting domain-containing protein n=1 Tax=Flavobacterium sp. TaxID=239 RepID=UPI0037C186E5
MKKIISLLGLFFVTAFAQSQVQTVFAGHPGGLQGQIDGIGTSAGFNHPMGMTIDVNGNLYVADKDNNSIRKITPSGLVTTIAGNVNAQGYQDGDVSVAKFNRPQGLTIDNLGNIFVADTNNMRIRKITPAGMVTTIAGSGVAGSANSIPLLSQFDSPVGIIIKDGIIYVSESCSIRAINLSVGVGYVYTFAGSTCGFSDGSTSNAKFNAPHGMIIDTNGNFIVADSGNNRIRRIEPNGNVYTIVGNGSAGNATSFPGPATFNRPTGITLDELGNLFVTDQFSGYIRKITSGLNVSNLNVGGLYCTGIVNDNNGNLFVSYEYASNIKKITGAILNIEENNSSNNVKIYPNPTKNFITIDCSNLTNVDGNSVKITNTLGQVVFNQLMNAQQYTVALNGLTGQGMYFANIIDAQGNVIFIKKIILQ